MKESESMQIIACEDVYSVEEIKKRLEPVFRARHIRKAILFGSYAQNQADRKSDVDILVDSGLRGLKFFGLVADMQAALEKEADVLDIHYVKENSPVDEEIARTGVTIYER